MKVSKANNYQQALKELNNLDPALAEKLSESIKESDRGMYHVAVISIESNPGQVKNNVSYYVTKLHKHSFERFKKNSIFQGVSKLIVVHDPSTEKGLEKQTVPTHQKLSVAEKVKRSLKAKHDAEIAEGIAEELKKQNTPEISSESTGNGNEDTKTPEEIELAKKQETEMIEAFKDVLENGKKDDFIALANDYGIEGMDKARDNNDRKEVLKNWINQ